MGFNLGVFMLVSFSLFILVWLLLAAQDGWPYNAFEINK